MAITAVSNGGMSQQKRKIVTYGRPKRAAFFSLEDDGTPSPKKAPPIAPDSSDYTAPSQESGAKLSVRSRAHTKPNPAKPSVFDVPSEDESPPSPTQPESRPSIPLPRNEAPPKKLLGTRLPKHGRNDRGSGIFGEEDNSLQVLARPSGSKTLKDKPIAPQGRRDQLGNGVRKRTQTPQESTAPIKEKQGAKRATEKVPGQTRPQPTKAETDEKGIMAVRENVFDVPSSDDESRGGRRQVSSSMTTPKASRVTNRQSQRPLEEAGQPVRKRLKVTPTRMIPHVKNTGPADVEKTPAPLELSAALETSTTSGHASSGLRNPRRILTTKSNVRKPIGKTASSPASIRIPRNSGGLPPESALTSTNKFDVEFETEVDPLSPRASCGASPMHIDSIRPVTPKQKKLWGNLLNEQDSIASPSQLKLETLELADENSKRKSLETSNDSKNDASRPTKRRLIDRLVPADPLSDDSSSQDERENASFSATHTLLVSAPAKPTEPLQTSESQGSTSQSQTVRATGTKITYAKQRSHLEESMLEGTDVLGVMGLESPIHAKPVGSSWSQPLSSGGKDPFAMDEDDDSDSAAAMKSIHELRAAGASRRFKNEMDAMFEDLEQPKAPKSSRRSALVELALKLADKQFTTKLLDNDLSRRLFNSSVDNYGDDPILGFAFAACVGFVLNTDKSSAVLADLRNCGTLRCLCTTLKHTLDVLRIAKQRQTNMSPAAQKSIADLQESIRRSGLFTSPLPLTISPMLLALRSLELSTRSLRKDGDREELLNGKQLRSILEIAKVSSSASSTGSVSSVDNKCVYYSLSIALDTMLGEAANQIWSLDNLEILRTMAASFLDIPPRFGERVEFVTTKLCLNLTNNNAETSELFASVDIVQSLLRSIERRFLLLTGPLDPVERSIALDHLVLGLGAMINLVEYSDSARTAVLAEGDVLLNAILRIHVDGRKKVSEADSIEDSSANVAHGYLSVLIANLCQNEDIRKKIRSKLPQGNLETLIQALQQFIDMQIKANDLSKQAEEDIWASYTNRLLSVVDRLKRSERSRE